MNSPVRSSLLAMALALGTAGTVVAAPGVAKPGDAASRLAEGLRFMVRVLHLQQHGDQVVSHAISIGSREATLELDLAAAPCVTFSSTTRGAISDQRAMFDSTEPMLRNGSGRWPASLAASW